MVGYIHSVHCTLVFYLSIFACEMRCASDGSTYMCLYLFVRVLIGEFLLWNSIRNVVEIAKYQFSKCAFRSCCTKTNNGLAGKIQCIALFVFIQCHVYFVHEFNFGHLRIQNPSVCIDGTYCRVFFNIYFASHAKAKAKKRQRQRQRRWCNVNLLRIEWIVIDFLAGNETNKNIYGEILFYYPNRIVWRCIGSRR